MEVAVSGVEHVGYAQLIPRSNAIGRVKHFRQTRARHHRILNHGIRRDAADSAKSSFARCPKFLSFILIASETAITRAVLQANALDTIRFLVDSCFYFIELD